MAKMIIEFKKSDSGEWFFRLKGVNGKVIITSETYKRKDHCVRIARKITLVENWKINGLYE